MLPKSKSPEKATIGGEVSFVYARKTENLDVAATGDGRAPGFGQHALDTVLATKWQNMNSRGCEPADEWPKRQFDPCGVGQFFVR